MFQIIKFLTVKIAHFSLGRDSPISHFSLLDELSIGEVLVKELNGRVLTLVNLNPRFPTCKILLKCWAAGCL
jgi:hypothetical protein